MFSTYAIASDRLLRRTDSLTAATWTAIGASIGVLSFGAVRGQLEAPTAHAMTAIIANGFATASAFTLWFVVLNRLGPTRTGICMALEAVTGVVLAALSTPASVELQETASPP